MPAPAAASKSDYVAPCQPRSQRTQDRLLDATEALLATRPFEEITVAEIVRRARRSVGSFYASFDAKRA